MICLVKIVMMINCDVDDDDDDDDDDNDVCFQ